MSVFQWLLFAVLILIVIILFAPVISMLDKHHRRNRRVKGNKSYWDDFSGDGDDWSDF